MNKLTFNAKDIQSFCDDLYIILKDGQYYICQRISETYFSIPFIDIDVEEFSECFCSLYKTDEESQFTLGLFKIQDDRKSHCIINTIVGSFLLTYDRYLLIADCELRLLSDCTVPIVDHIDLNPLNNEPVINEIGSKDKKDYIEGLFDIMTLFKDGLYLNYSMSLSKIIHGLISSDRNDESLPYCRTHMEKAEGSIVIKFNDYKDYLVVYYDSNKNFYGKVVCSNIDNLRKFNDFTIYTKQLERLL